MRRNRRGASGLRLNTDPLGWLATAERRTAFCMALLLAVAFSGDSLLVAVGHAQAPLDTEAELELGRFELGPYRGLVRLDGRGNRLSVLVAVEHSVENQSVDPAAFAAWLLLPEGGSVPRRGLSTLGRDGKPLMFRGGGEWSMFAFEFDPANPVALVLRVGGEYQVFAVAGAVLRWG